MQGLLIVPAEVKNAQEASCELPKFGTVSNVVVSVVDPFGAAPTQPLQCRRRTAPTVRRFSRGSPCFLLIRPQTFRAGRDGLPGPDRPQSRAADPRHDRWNGRPKPAGGTNISALLARFPPASVLEDVDLSLTLGDGRTW